MPECERRRRPLETRLRMERAHRCRHERLTESCESVPVAPFRERFLYLKSTGQITSQDLCWHMGWATKLSDDACRKERRRPGTVRPHTYRVGVTLGLRPYRRPGCVESKTQEFVTYEVAEKLCKALGMDPFEAGI